MTSTDHCRWLPREIFADIEAVADVPAEADVVGVEELAVQLAAVVRASQGRRSHTQAQIGAGWWPEQGPRLGGSDDCRSEAEGGVAARFRCDRSGAVAASPTPLLPSTAASSLPPPQPRRDLKERPKMRQGPRRSGPHAVIAAKDTATAPHPLILNPAWRSRPLLRVQPFWFGASNQFEENKKAMNIQIL
ncbi:unnamed protein product [Urochloa humidicola]